MRKKMLTIEKSSNIMGNLEIHFKHRMLEKLNYHLQPKALKLPQNVQYANKKPCLSTYITICAV